MRELSVGIKTQHIVVITFITKDTQVFSMSYDFFTVEEIHTYLF
jgi:hypothetical protein